jgi:tetratricopeptide (TPR) repeat protein
VPSLDNLEKFRNSFRNIGSEAEHLAAQNIPFEEFSLPDAKAPPSTEGGGVAALVDGDMTEQIGALDAVPDFDLDSLFDSPADAAGAGDDDFDFSDFLNSAVPAPGSDDLPDFTDTGAPPPLDDGIPSLDDGPVDPDFSLDDMPDFADTGAPPLDDGIPSLDDVPVDPDFSLDDMPDFTDTGASPPLDDGIPSLDDVPVDPDFSLDDMPDFADNEAPPPLDDDISNSDDTSIDNLPDFDEDSNADKIQPDNLEAPAAFEGPGPGDVEPPALDEEPVNFNVPGLDDILNKSTADVNRGNLPKSADNIEEIELSDNDLEHLQNALASYPLNLRIACEELIAEEAVAPDMMSKLIKLLVKEAPAQETAELAGKILGRIISIPKGFEKKSGAELEAEKSSFSYLFIHKFLPILGFTLFGILVGISLIYLIHTFVYTPIHAESIYKDGYADLETGQYAQANEKFAEAFKLHPVKKWFYSYAQAFTDKRQYIHAEKKYKDLLKYYPKEKKGALEYAALETRQLQNYAEADSILRRYILDFFIDDKEALIAVGDNALEWGEIDTSKYEVAREAYARFMERYGQSDPVLERMMKYFIRTDNLKEVLPLQKYFTDTTEAAKKRTLSPDGFTELGGYLLDKQFEETSGVPDENISEISGVRDLLLSAVEKAPSSPEAHFNLARYYHHFNSNREERSVLERAIPLFDSAGESTVKRLKKRIDAEEHYAQALIKNKEFFAAEEQLQKGISLYEDALSRNILPPTPEFGRLYADMGDLDYFTKEGDMEMALRYYSRAEQNGWTPPEMQYRMGAAYYRQGQWAQAQERFFEASSRMPFNRRILNTLGNIAFKRGDYFAAHGYYSRLLDVLNTDKSRFSRLVPQERPDHYALAERLMVAQNNMGVVLETLTERTGNPAYRSQALDYYINSSIAWDSLTRDPATLVRSGITDLAAPGVNLAGLNSQNAFNPEAGYDPQIYVEIDHDVLEPSEWEELTSQTPSLSEP